MTVNPPVPTSEQLGVSNSRMLWRGLLRQCPACATRDAHVSYTTMRSECPECSLKFERIFGHSLGYIGLNVTVTFTLTFLVLLVGAIITQPDIPIWPMVGLMVLSAVVFPAVFLPSAHTMWTAIDMIARPLEPGEIDPRYIEVDPEAGDWTREP